MAKKRGNGEGSISRRKNGGWIAQYAVYTAEGRKRKTLYGKTRAVVAKKLTKAMADRDGGLILDAGKLTVGEYLERWLAGSVKEATYANYGHFARKHICPALGRLKLKNLTPAHVRSFYGKKSRSGLSAATVKQMHVVLHRALSQAVTDGLIWLVEMIFIIDVGIVIANNRCYRQAFEEPQGFQRRHIQFRWWHAPPGRLRT